MLLGPSRPRGVKQAARQEHPLRHITGLHAPGLVGEFVPAFVFGERAAGPDRFARLVGAAVLKMDFGRDGRGSPGPGQDPAGSGWPPPRAPPSRVVEPFWGAGGLMAVRWVTAFLVHQPISKIGCNLGISGIHDHRLAVGPGDLHQPRAARSSGDTRRTTGTNPSTRRIHHHRHAIFPGDLHQPRAARSSGDTRQSGRTIRQGGARRGRRSRTRNTIHRGSSRRSKGRRDTRGRGCSGIRRGRGGRAGGKAGRIGGGGGHAFTPWLRPS
jgi:hypothetical protein